MFLPISKSSGGDTLSALAAVAATGTSGVVNTFADLPSVIDNSGKVYRVNTPTGVRFVNKKWAGEYRSNGVTWTRLGTLTNQLTSTDVVDNLLSTNPNVPLSANQGRILAISKLPKITRFTAGIGQIFTPDPYAVRTLIQMQGAGGSGGCLSSIPATYGCALGSGANGGNYLEGIINQPLTGNVFLNVGGVTSVPTTQNTNGYYGTDSTFGSFLTVRGGAGGRVTTGTHLAVILSSNVQPTTYIGWGGTQFTELLNITGQLGTSPWIPYFVEIGQLRGGDGGGSHWGHASRSELAIHSSRGGYVSINHDGSGYGYGGCGIAAGTRTAYVGNIGGPGLTIITEYLQ